MSPDASSRVTNACTCDSWRGSVVRMKSSFDRLNGPSSLRNSAEFSSASACGVMPRSFALFSTFWPCSSVPVRKNTSRPSSRIARAQTSQSVVVYALPMWGRSFT